mgnify:CR=1 FL=1
MDKDDSHDISQEEFVSFCLQQHGLPAAPAHSRSKQKRKEGERAHQRTKKPMTRRNSAPYPDKARSRFGRSSSRAADAHQQALVLSGEISAGEISAGSRSGSRSLSPALRRSVTRLHSDAEFYNEKKERFKEELMKHEEDFLHETRDKWRNDMIRHRITGSPQHHPSRTKSAPRSSVAVGLDLYAKDMKWKEVRQRSLDTLAATIKEKKDKEEEKPTFRPKLATEEFNEANQISSVVGNSRRAAHLKEVAEQRQQQLDQNMWPGSSSSDQLFRPKISHKSEMLAQRRRLVRDTLDLSPPGAAAASSPGARVSSEQQLQQQQQLDQENAPHPNTNRDVSAPISTSTSASISSPLKSPGLSLSSSKSRAKSPSLFVHLYQVIVRYQ